MRPCKHNKMAFIYLSKNRALSSAKLITERFINWKQYSLLANVKHGSIEFNTSQQRSWSHTDPVWSSICHHRNQYSTSTPGVLTSFLQTIGVKSSFKYHKYVLRNSSLRLYLCCVELVDHDAFIHEFRLPDTLNSWFRVTELHIWLCMVRLAQEGVDGKFLRNQMLQYMWDDLDKKTKKLGELATLSARKDGLMQLYEQFKAVLFAYDEGLLSDDKVLAGALWRNFFEKNCQEAAHLDTMVEYVHKQMSHLNKVESNVLLSVGIVDFLPLFETLETKTRNNQILAQIMKRI